MAKRQFHWSTVNDCVMHETDGTGATTVEYTHEPGPFGPLISETRGGVTSTHHYDALGSTTMLTDDTGAVTDTFQYDAWGTTVARTGTTPTPYTWCGRWGYQDDLATTGGYYIRARSYRPTVARWMSVDPAGFRDRPNRYLFCRLRALTLIDPSGLEAITDQAFSGAYQGFVWHVDRDACKIVLEVRIELNYVDNNGPSDVWTARTKAVWRDTFVGLVRRSFNSTPVYIVPGSTLEICCKCPKWTPMVDVDVVNGPGATDLVITVGRKDDTSRTGDHTGTWDWYDITLRSPDEDATDADRAQALAAGLPIDQRPEMHRTHKQYTVVHEFGHLIGLRHPGMASGRLDPVFSGDYVDYWWDANGLMGFGMEMRSEYYPPWSKYLDREYPACAKYIPKGADGPRTQETIANS